MLLLNCSHVSICGCFLSIYPNEKNGKQAQTVAIAKYWFGNICVRTAEASDTTPIYVIVFFGVK